MIMHTALALHNATKSRNTIAVHIVLTRVHNIIRIYYVLLVLRIIKQHQSAKMMYTRSYCWYLHIHAGVCEYCHIHDE